MATSCPALTSLCTVSGTRATRFSCGAVSRRTAMRIIQGLERTGDSEPHRALSRRPTEVYNPPMPAQVHVFAPGSVGNVGPGLDILGLAVGGAGDEVRAERHPGGGVVIEDPGHPALPADARAHTSGIAAAEVLRAAGVTFGLRLWVRKGLPLAGGQGGREC